MSNIIKEVHQLIGHKEEFKQLLSKQNLNYCLIACAFFIGTYFGWSLKSIAIFCLLIWVILEPKPISFFAKGALLFLIFVPLSLIANRSIAEQFAILAFYCLIIVVVKTFFQAINENQEPE